MANLWLRLYHDMPNDPKWRTIARVSQQPIPLVLAVYLHLLVIASQATDRGAVMNVNTEDIGSALDTDSAAIDAVLSGMGGRVIENDRLSGWDKRQVVREDGASERAKAWRERNRTQPNANERQIKKREEEIKTKTSTLASTANAVPASKGKLLGTLPLNDGSEWQIFADDVDVLQPLYPAVDVHQELRSMKGWLIGNPTLRKTRRGIRRFIASWLEQEQDKAKTGGNIAKPSRIDKINHSDAGAFQLLGGMGTPAYFSGGTPEAGGAVGRLLEGAHGAIVAGNG